jgi:ketosteroid isomerase-like protein
MSGKMLTADQAQIVDLIRTVFVALGSDDPAMFRSVVTPDFYLFEGGVRFDEAGMTALIKSAHDAGKIIEWSVTEADVRVSGEMAWIAYVNKGSITDVEGTRPQSWLESGCLEKRDGAWKIAFLHSTRVPPPT